LDQYVFFVVVAIIKSAWPCVSSGLRKVLEWLLGINYILCCWNTELLVWAIYYYSNPVGFLSAHVRLVFQIIHVSWSKCCLCSHMFIFSHYFSGFIWWLDLLCSLSWMLCRVEEQHQGVPLVGEEDNKSCCLV